MRRVFYYALQAQDSVPPSGMREPCPAGTKYCDAHRSLHPEENHSAAGRGYNSRWYKVSRQFLFVHPLCAECLKSGKYVRATVVDHIVPHRGDKTLFWDQNNWQALCKRCHDRKTRLHDQTPTYHY